MNWASIGEGAIGAGIGMLGSAISQRQNYKYTKKLMELQYQQNLDLWNKQNEYNTPTAQMQRLQAAGLNPNLVYGSSVAGNSSNNTSTSLGSVPAVDYNEGMFKGVSAVTNMKLARSTVRRQETQNQLDLALAANKALDTQYLRETLNSRVSYQNELTKFSLQQWPLILQQQKNVITIQGKDIDLKMQEYYNAQRTGDLIAEQTRLTRKQSDELALKIEAYPIYLENIQSQTYANRVNANANAQNAATNALRASYQNALDEVCTSLKITENELKKSTMKDIINSEHFKSLTQQEQFLILQKYGWAKAFIDAYGSSGTIGSILNPTMQGAREVFGLNNSESPSSKRYPSDYDVRHDGFVRRDSRGRSISGSW